MAFSKCPVVYVNIYTVDDKYVPFHRFQQLPIETVLRDKGAIENEGLGSELVIGLSWFRVPHSLLPLLFDRKTHFLWIRPFY